MTRHVPLVAAAWLAALLCCCQPPTPEPLPQPVPVTPAAVEPVKVSQFPYRWQTVPPPAAVQVRDAGAQALFGAPPFTPAAPLTIEVAFTLIGWNGGSTLPSPPVTVQLQRGCLLSARLPGVPANTPAVAWQPVWRVVGTTEWMLATPELRTQPGLSTFCSFTPAYSPENRGSHILWPCYPPTPLSTLPTPATAQPPPVGPPVPLIAPDTAPDVATLWHLPPGPLTVAVAYADMFGHESALTPVPATTSGALTLIRAEETPPGACAVYLYAGPDADHLTRQKHAGGSCLWPIWLHTLELHNLTTTGVRYDASAAHPCQSLLSPLDAALASGAKDILVDVPALDVFCPCVSRYDPSLFGRAVRAQPRCEITLRSAVNGQALAPQAGPMLLNYGRCVYSGLRFSGDTATAGIAFADNTGGGSFAVTLDSCYCWCPAPGAVGLLVSADGGLGRGNHVASEILARGCHWCASKPVVFEGDQAANLRSYDTRLLCLVPSKYQTETAMIVDRTPCMVSFEGGLFLDAAWNGNQSRSLFSVNAPSGQASLWVSVAFDDATSAPVLIEAGGYNGAAVRLDRSTFNLHRPAALSVTTGGPLTLDAAGSRVGPAGRWPGP